MIQTDEELVVVEKQLALMERSLESLRREVKNERNFELYSQAEVEQIAQLKAEIDDYRSRQNGRDQASANGEPDQARSSPGGVREGSPQ